MKKIIIQNESDRAVFCHAILTDAGDKDSLKIDLYDFEHKPLNPIGGRFVTIRPGETYTITLRRNTEFNGNWHGTEMLAQNGDCEEGWFFNILSFPNNAN